MEKKGKEGNKGKEILIDSQALPLGRKYPCEIVSLVYEEMRRYPGEKAKDEWG